MTEYADEEQRVFVYLRDSVSRSEGHFWTKDIAEAIGFTARQVGSRLP